jgi:type IV pilus assembly protein PilM
VSVLSRLSHLLKEPPPEYAFELSEAGIAWARLSAHPQVGFQPIEPGVISVSPLRDNVLQADALTARARLIAPGNGARKPRRAALILPDYSARVSVLDFDSFPSDPIEQLSLVRFRIKKTVPFDIESAAISFHPQTVTNGGKRVEVVAAVVSLEVVARFEAAFRAAGFQTGMVTVSSLAALALAPAGGMSVLVRISGKTLTVSVLNRGHLKLLRCVELDEVNLEEILGILHPTFAYIEDELKARPEAMLACGFGAMAAEMAARAQSDFGLAIEPLRSRFGAPGQENAGLLGYLETVED